MFRAPRVDVDFFGTNRSQYMPACAIKPPKDLFETEVSRLGESWLQGAARPPFTECGGTPISEEVAAKLL